MKKNSLLVAVLATLSLSANAAVANYELPMDELLCGYNSSYDSATGTLTFGNAWVGSGWYWDAPQEPKDFSQYDYVMVDYEPGVTDMELKIKYSDNTEDYQRLSGSSIKMPLSNDKKSGVTAIYFFTLKNDNSITLKDACLGAYDTTADVTLFEGACEVTGWDPAVLITRDEFKEAHMLPGDKLVVTAKAESEGGFIKMMFDEAGNLEVWDAFKSVAGYADETVPVSTAGSNITVKLNEAVIAQLTASTTNNIRIIGSNVTVTKVEVVREGNIQTGINSAVMDDADAPVEYFNLQGVRVENPVNGMYIRRQGNNVTKIIL